MQNKLTGGCSPGHVAANHEVDAGKQHPRPGECEVACEQFFSSSSDACEVFRIQRMLTVDLPMISLTGTVLREKARAWS